MNWYLKLSARKWKKTPGVPHSRDDGLISKVLNLANTINPVTSKNYNTNEISKALGMSFQTVSRILSNNVQPEPEPVKLPYGSPWRRSAASLNWYGRIGRYSQQEVGIDPEQAVTPASPVVPATPTPLQPDAPAMPHPAMSAIGQGVQTMLTRNPRGGMGFFTLVGNTQPLNKAMPLGKKGLKFSYFKGSWGKRVDFVSEQDRAALMQYGVDVSPLDSPLAQIPSSEWPEAPQQDGPNTPATKKINDLRKELEKDIAEGKPNEQVKKMTEFVTNKLEQLAASTDEAAKSDFIRSFLAFSSKFYRYSLSNQFLIWAQNPDATYVSGHAQWLKKGRQVTDWGSPISIIAPKRNKYDKKTNDPNNPTEEVSYMSFMAVKVYDISSTSPVPNWKSKDGDPPFEPQEWKQDTNEDIEEINLLVNAGVSFANSVGVDTNLKEKLPANHGGWSAGGKIAINDTFLGVNLFSTLVHELAHEALHWDKDMETSTKTTRTERRNMRKAQETDAESTAYVVLNYFGFETKDSPNYLSLYGVKSKDIMDRRKQINLAARLLINGITEHTKSAVESQGQNELV